MVLYNGIYYETIGDIPHSEIKAVSDAYRHHVIVEFTEAAHFYDQHQTDGMPVLVNRRTGDVYRVLED